MTNDEIPNDERNPNDEARMTKGFHLVSFRAGGYSSFGLRHSFVIGNFVIRHSLPGIQFVPASGTPAIAAASTVRATRSSRSRWCTFDLPQARASVAISIVSTWR